MNKVLLSGALGKDVEVKAVGEKGTLLAKFSLACTSAGNKEPITNWVNCVAWGKSAEKLAGCKKGNRICIEGFVAQTSYEKDGKKIYQTQVTVEYVFAGGISAAVTEQTETPYASKPAAVQQSFGDDDIPY